MGQSFYIVSVYHTQRQHRYVTLWRPKNAGYCWPLSWAGEYDEDAVRAALNYYNDGERNLAVRAEALKELGVDPESGIIDGNAGPVIPNTRFSWDVILRNLIEPPLETPVPEYPRKRKAA